ncbi:MAG: dehydrogenase [Firmicutes bacterium HGW-Firmicutes-7]|nr:MAG: dehydrogenase [Firmicutes bacterium HGW-Firmicutes-7]
MKQIKAAIIGIGFVGAVHIEALRRLGYVEIIALVDEYDAEKKAEKYNIPSAFSSYKEMINISKPDIIHICTPNHTHFEIAAYALNRNIHVLCEKPMTTTLEEAKALVSLAKEKKLIHAVNYHNRFYPMAHHMKETIKDGTIGKIFSIHGGYLQDWLLYPTDFNWRLVSSQSGKTRVVSDIGAHWMDLAEYVSGLKIVEVFAEFTTFHKSRKKPVENVTTFSKSEDTTEYEEVPIDTEDFASILLRFENGAVGSATISQAFAGKKNKLSLLIAGSTMSLELDSDDLSNVIIGHRDQPNQVLTKDLALIHTNSKKLVSYPSGHTEGFADAFKHCFNQVYQSIIDSEATIEYATFEDGYHEMLLAEKLFESAKKGCWIKL